MRTSSCLLLAACLAASAATSPARADGPANDRLANVGPEALLFAPPTERLSLACELVDQGGPEDVAPLAEALRRTTDLATWRQLAFVLHLRLADCPEPPAALRAALAARHRVEIRLAAPDLQGRQVIVHDVRARDGVARVAAHVVGNEGRPVDETWVGLYRQSPAGGWTPIAPPSEAEDPAGPARNDVAVDGSCGLLAASSPAVTTLLETASAPTNTAERRQARDVLFHQVVPQLRVSGRPAATDEATAMLAALGGQPCASGRLQVVASELLGDAARVSIGGDVGGCTVLMRRTPLAWQQVMALGWTLR